MTNLSSDRSPGLPWWTSPAGIHLGFLLPILLMIAYVGSTGYSGLTIRSIRFLTADYIVLGCGILLVSALCGWMGSQVAWTATAAGSGKNWDRAAYVVGAISLIAYVYWFRDLVFNPLLLVKTLFGAHRPDRTNIELTTGVTSLANVSPVFFAIYAYQVLVLRRPLHRRLHLMCLAIVCFTVLRVYAWSERLAMIEAAVPFGLAAATAMYRSGGWGARIVRLGPFAAIPLLILYFATFEFFRSWNSATYNRHFGFWEFALGRLASYYYTSLNNGAGVLSTQQWPSFQFENVLNWLHRAPLVGPIFSAWVDLRQSQLAIFLTKFGDVEFNNPSGLYSVIYDLGLPLGLLYFGLVAFAGGLMYRRYRAGSLSGVILYPIAFMTFLEVLRLPYLGSSRTFTCVLGAGIALLVGARSAKKPASRKIALDPHPGEVSA
jgi:hypothetical protein